ncbi:phosphonate metabolism protein/1,5-bisphosphokinase (PRPP-forming) PhnN [Rhodoplanes sp. TEM]|uniref:Multifunctional fusion protein n=1 Tax=Rhodoplanes tepidamans TaxID=200616 RepID=A0ABT5JF86_RHOTP|nr:MULTISPECIES: phosphonate metabolism protein/1,5-bisphosphokinase (PRPP-forming) PhnN [Rhodoplanes]MDC7788353.1 phosphonate metabolism protein/1,5-bisphosphokinase (PRPP-forming) PhnN [Rhodoplanes tepidamans]MDC7986095.1 phosphonate metabolism protein/1,5-bisphosphokinase (PRPP-forming) PhnN [Rhodoplanes sp. TEM]MDQ0358834.1 thymidine phosphorylase [Rhodoplanes tepidamans]
MTPGVLFFVVGPSGSGKDTLLDGARAALGGTGRFAFARRVITRPADAGGEAHEAVDAATFARMKADGAFLIDWEAHGLAYGVPARCLDDLARGRHVIANGSRAVVADLLARVPDLVVVEITAPPELLARRLAGRGRETADVIRARLARTTPPFPEAATVVRVANDSTPQAGTERFVAALEAQTVRLTLTRLPLAAGQRALAVLPRDSSVVRAEDYLGPGRIDLAARGRSIRAEVALADPGTLAPDSVGLTGEVFERLGLPEGTPVVLTRTPTPASRAALRAKIRGGTLDEADYARVVGDIVEGRYPDSEVAGFLVAADRGLDDDEVLALARVRASFALRIRWDEPIVADKHSMGGIPGSRVTMVLVPIVAAHGLAIPKTSSRAITSAAGTADAMETLARVDLDADDVRRVVAQARGCVAWNGRLNHSTLDDVMNAITRPLGLESTRWSVASILSKKLAAGATHVVLDLPYGPRARIKSLAEATTLAQLFERVGAGLGLSVEAVPTDGTAPIGRGIGPALEARDVIRVLENDTAAPADLREKVLHFAGRIIAWDPAVGSREAARRRAEDLLGSGAAREALDRIVAAQGAREPIRPGRLTHTVVAPHAGVVTDIDGFAVAGIARVAGAPLDKSAGIDLRARVGDPVGKGEALFVIHASAATDLEAAAQLAATFSGFTIGEAKAASAG